MNQTERIYKIDNLLKTRRFVSKTVFLEELGVSWSTFKRDLECMRSRFEFPIIWDPVNQAYRYDPSPAVPKKTQLPGLWFNAGEAQALLTMHHLLENLQPGLLGPHIAPIKGRIQVLLGKGEHDPDTVRDRIRILTQAARKFDLEYFEQVSHAVLSRKRIIVDHYNRGRDETLTRELSPQRLVHYRDNWYLDAWCHLRKGLRTFSLDSIKECELLNKKARNVAKKTLDSDLGAGYGIFAGKKVQTAKLRFTPERARWVASEQWHPEQRGRFDKDGYYILEVPYSNEPELVMDILQYGKEVRVLGPASLRKIVIDALEEAVSNY